MKIVNHPVKKMAMVYFVLFIGSVLLGYGSIYINAHIKNNNSNNSTHYSKDIILEKILTANNINEKRLWYIRLLETVGPEEAQDDLNASGIPYTGSSHLLNHTAGDYIWTKFGPEGFSKCKNYFSSSCYHGFILNALGDGEFENLEPMLEECKKVSSDAYGQCMHAIGHGFLPYVGYANIPDALALCDNIRKSMPDFRVDYCYNGVFMENIWGLHEGEPSEDRWLDENDITYPCSDSLFTDEQAAECWYNQAQHLITVFNNDLIKVASVCVERQGRAQETCFDGLFRSFHSISQNNLRVKYDTCRKMPDKWANVCIALQAGSSFQQGDREFPYKICEETDFGQPECFSEIAKMISHYYRPGTVHSDLCRKVPQGFRNNHCKITTSP